MHIHISSLLFKWYCLKAFLQQNYNCVLLKYTVFTSNATESCRHVRSYTLLHYRRSEAHWYTRFFTNLKHRFKIWISNHILLFFSFTFDYLSLSPSLKHPIILISISILYSFSILWFFLKICRDLISLYTTLLIWKIKLTNSRC